LIDYIFTERPKKKRIRAFLERHPRLSKEEQRIVKMFEAGFTPTVERLIRACASNKGAYDLRQFVEQAAERMARGNPLLRILPIASRRIRSLGLVTLPREIFLVDNGIVRLNDANEKLLIQLGREIGLIQNELGDKAKQKRVRPAARGARSA
jgi:hypothetical protein